MHQYLFFIGGGNVAEAIVNVSSMDSIIALFGRFPEVS